MLYACKRSLVLFVLFVFIQAEVKQEDLDHDLVQVLCYRADSSIAASCDNDSSTHRAHPLTIKAANVTR
jgi:hypothetical protein